MINNMQTARNRLIAIVVVTFAAVMFAVAASDNHAAAAGAAQEVPQEASFMRTVLWLGVLTMILGVGMILASKEQDDR
jgi:hypothetical protein